MSYLKGAITYAFLLLLGALWGILIAIALSVIPLWAYNVYNVVTSLGEMDQVVGILSGIGIVIVPLGAAMGAFELLL